MFRRAAAASIAIHATLFGVLSNLAIARKVEKRPSLIQLAIRDPRPPALGDGRSPAADPGPPRGASHPPAPPKPKPKPTPAPKARAPKIAVAPVGPVEVPAPKQSEPEPAAKAPAEPMDSLSLGSGTGQGGGGGVPNGVPGGEGRGDGGGPARLPSKNVPPHILAQALLQKVEVTLPPAVLVAHRGERIRIAVLMCVGSDGAVDRAQTRILAGVPGADDAVLETMRRWRYRPQPIPLCAPVNLEIRVMN